MLRVLIITCISKLSLGLFMPLKMKLKTSHFLSKEFYEDELEDAVSVVMADEPLALPQERNRKRGLELIASFFIRLLSLTSLS